MECFARRRSEFKEGSKSQNGNDQQQTAFLALGSEHGHIVHDEEGEGGMVRRSKSKSLVSGRRCDVLSSLGPSLDAVQ